MASADLRKELECSICLSLYTDPVTLRCGHNFCRLCIDQHLTTQGESGVYSCPECREEFQERPVLKRNITLCNVVESLLSTQPHPEEIYILCTYCVDYPVPAAKSCLHCEASLCEDHLKVHSTGPEHVLTVANASLEKRKCSVHKKILEFFCPEDGACICVSCSLAGEHRGHQVETLGDASEKKKKRLQDLLQKLSAERRETEEEVQSLEKSRRKVQEKASGEAERVTALIADIRRWLDNLEERILREISRQEMQMSLPLSDMIQKLEIQKAELAWKMWHIEKLCNITDPLTVLQEPDTGDLCDPEEGGGDEDTWGHDRGNDSMKEISQLPQTLSDVIRGLNVTFYFQDPADISLDVNTAANNILILDDLKTATSHQTQENRPETAERFQDYPQVMSITGFTSGRHYWDVEISGSDLWSVGMCYPSMDRKGGQSFIGGNNKSWALWRSPTDYPRYFMRHNGQVNWLPYDISSSGRVRIYVDYEAGELSFYELCDPITHLYTFFTTFTEPLHALLTVYNGSLKILVESSN